MGVVLHISLPCNIVIREGIAIQYMYSEAYMRGCCITYQPALQYSYQGRDCNTIQVQ